MDTPEITFTNSEAQIFYNASFKPLRDVTVEQYEAMLKASTDPKFQALRQSARGRVAHNISVTRDYVQNKPFDTKYDDISDLDNVSDESLLKLLSDTTQEVASALANPDLSKEDFGRLRWLSAFEGVQHGLNMVEMASLGLNGGPKQQAMWGKDGYLGPKQI